MIYVVIMLTSIFTISVIIILELNKHCKKINEIIIKHNELIEIVRKMNKKI